MKPLRFSFAVGWRWCSKTLMCSCSTRLCLTRSRSARCSCAGPRTRFGGKSPNILDQLEISHLKDRAPHRLSGGEKKRVALASVLILDPEVLLMDEPTAALD